MSLSKKDLDSFRHALESKRAELVRAHGKNVTQGTRSEEDNFADPMDAATRAEEEAEHLGLAHQERNLLTEIDRALQKIERGTYGVSELSGDPIPIERLRAIPWARLTAEEEELRERL
jgi:DnaK suppressor protein